MNKPILSLVKLSLMEFQIGKAVMFTYPPEQKYLKEITREENTALVLQSVLLITVMEVPCFFPVHFP